MNDKITVQLRPTYLEVLLNSNNFINKVHEKSLRIVSCDNHDRFKSLLSKCKEITIHQRNLQVLKIITGISPPIMETNFTSAKDYYWYISTNYGNKFYENMLRENTRNVIIFQEISNENRKIVK